MYTMTDDPQPYLISVQENISKEIFGLENVIRLMLVAFYTEGHVLLEGNPGMGKTSLVKALCKALGFDEKRWGRIQFTPDLMPSDITGSLMPDENNPTKFVFHEGPIFKWLLLADEINRATPKTQAAMLEAMGEKQVTYAGVTHKLGADKEDESINAPFMVMATQNPIDEEGTFHLPKAQADRFMFKIIMPKASSGMLRRILHKNTGSLSKLDSIEVYSSDKESKACHSSESDALEYFFRIKDRILNNEPQEIIEKHICNIIIISNATHYSDSLKKEVYDIKPRELKNLIEMMNKYFSFGLSPRAATSMMLGAKAWAVLFGGNSGEEDTLTGFAETVLPAIRHRMHTSSGWDIDSIGNNENNNQALDKILSDFIIKTSPNDNYYKSTLKNMLDRQISIE